MLKYEERVENTFSELIKGLQAEFLKFREEFEYINITEKIADVYDKIKANKENDLNAEKLHWAMKAVNKSGVSHKVKDELQMRLLKQGIIDIYLEVIERLPPYYSLKHVETVDANLNASNRLGHIEDKYMNKRKQTSGIMGEHFQYL